MKSIELSAVRRCKNRGLFVAMVDDEDVEYVSRFSWYANVIKLDGAKYVFAARNSTTGNKHSAITMHREIWERMNGPIAVGVTVDHINHGEFGGLDNRRANLRLANRQEQQGNRRKGLAAASKFKGVYWHRRAGKWAAQIHKNDYPSYLGLFVSEEEAARAYDSAAKIHFGEYAHLNFDERRVG